MDARLSMHFGATSPARLARTEPERLVDSHLGLVRRIALQVHWRMSSSIEVDDLIQIGRVALIEAARAFEDRGHVAFAFYAAMRVRGAMIDELRKSAHLLRSAMRRRREFRQVRTQLQGELGRAPLDAEMAARVDMPLDTYRAAVRADHGVFHDSLDDAYSDHELAFADDAPSAFDNLEGKALRTAVAAAITALPRREAMVLQLYFIDEHNLEDIGRTMGVSAPRVCQIKKVALGHVRAKLSGWAA